MTNEFYYTALAAKIDAVLPQTQCTKCGYSGCKPYANAIAAGEADINQCPPGGDAGIHKLVELLQRPYKPLNPQNGIEKALTLAVIEEAVCIGCTLCIKACPVDAISGAAKVMHTVVADLCTGCELCVAPCPVDCISMEPLYDQQEIAHRKETQQAFSDASRKRFEFRTMRLERDKREKAEKMAAHPTNTATASDAMPANVVDPKKALIAAAMARAKAQREALTANTSNSTGNDS